MTVRPYHHGNLREALLERAAVVVREDGVDALSLRSLARDVGVSHAAPRRHFADRQALLDALVIDGFDRLGRDLHAAAEDSGDEFSESLSAITHAYVAFAVHDSELLGLMFASKHGADGEINAEFETAMRTAFDPVMSRIVAAQDAGLLPPGDAEDVALVQLATITGIATLLGAGMITADQVDGLLRDSLRQFLAAAAVQTQA